MTISLHTQHRTLNIPPEVRDQINAAQVGSGWYGVIRDLQQLGLTITHRRCR